MPCYHPMTAYRSAETTTTGKQKIVFDKSKSNNKIPLELPCGQCIGCRLRKSQEWALRCLHEASLYDQNSFITLTYNDENLPRDRSLDKEVFQKFMKRLRRSVHTKSSTKRVRFFHCGEYGSECKQCGQTGAYCLCTNPRPGLGRPHYHAIIFNHDFDDKILWTSREGINLYTSEQLSRLWQNQGGESMGFATVGDVTIESAAYVARYCVKKITGDQADYVYPISCEVTGEIIGYRQPEYATMSRASGIGREWFKQYGNTDCYPKDFITESGKRFPVPKYYEGLYHHEKPEQLERIKEARQLRAAAHSRDNTEDRLITRERCKLAQTKNLKRDLY